ncbi:unnamed protein product [Agarophyton chilense]|eukprot:gb/GEZJ01003962.1/.p1 GENE.gb/GEZJ01003962.1/~~gb/GEZJ01003962.1/.p1  ORF type:complete len:124 (-),score=14.62 gb/GEZJ01003962.1/:599-970(-)
MGSVWSYETDPQHYEAVEMRLASREVCDDETWANTVLNRSSCSVQQRLNMLVDELHGEELHGDERHRKRTPSIEFAPHDMVRVFEVDVRSNDVDSDHSDCEDREHPLQHDMLHSSMLFDTDLW